MVRVGVGGNPGPKIGPGAPGFGIELKVGVGGHPDLQVREIGGTRLVAGEKTRIWGGSRVGGLNRDWVADIEHFRSARRWVAAID